MTMTEAAPTDVDGHEAADRFAALLTARHSCRAFRPQPVETTIIRRILELSQRTASWCNSQPWQIHISRGAGTETLRRALTERAATGHMQSDIAFPEAYEAIYLARRRDCGAQLYQAAGIEKSDRAATARQALQNMQFFGAPHLAVITTERKLGTYGAIDCGAYVSNFMLAAQAFGIATIAQAAIATQSDILRERLGLPAERLVVCGISFGYAQTDAPVNGFRTPRAAIDDVLTWVDH